MSNVINLFEVLEKRKEDRAEEIHEDVIGEVLESCLYVTRQTLEILQEEGFDIYDHENAHDVALLIESIKGLAYKTLEVKFPTQQLSRILFDIPDPQEFIDSFYE